MARKPIGFAIGFDMNLKDIDDLAQALSELPDAMMGQVIHEAGKIAMRPVLAAAKRRLGGGRSNWPYSMGLLRKSLGVRSKIYKRGKQRGTVWVGVGARSGFKKQVQRPVYRKAGKNPRKGGRGAHVAGKARWANPTQYLHLIERGFRVRGRKIAGRRFLQNAFEESAPQAIAAFVAGARQRLPVLISRHFARLAAKRG